MGRYTRLPWSANSWDFSAMPWAISSHGGVTIFSAAAQAQSAVAYLHGLQGEAAEELRAA